jgi:hypothetical protein
MDGLYRRNVARTKLTRNIAATFDPVHDEVVGGLEDGIPTVDQDASQRLLEGVLMVHV